LHGANGFIILTQNHPITSIASIPDHASQRLKCSFIEEKGDDSRVFTRSQGLIDVGVKLKLWYCRADSNAYHMPQPHSLNRRQQLLPMR
jgi:hypothetical protein